MPPKKKKSGLTTSGKYWNLLQEKSNGNGQESVRQHSAHKDYTGETPRYEKYMIALGNSIFAFC